MGTLLARAWARWKVIAHIIGNLQARLLLSLFYFVVVPPFSLVVKLFQDPLTLRPPEGDGLWVERPSPVPSSEAARRQF